MAEQRKREETYRQLLAQGVLAVLLPTEDLENTCLRTLVGDILADLILGEVLSGQVAQGWFIWEATLKFITELKQSKPVESNDVERTPKSRLERFGLVSTQSDSTSSSDSPGKGQSFLSVRLWSFLQYIYLAYVAIRFVFAGLFQVASPSSFMPVRGFVVSETISSPPKGPATETQTHPWPSGSPVRLPVVNYRIFGMVSQLVDLSRRMPWLGGFLALVQHILLTGPGQFGEADGLVDR